MVGVTGIEPVTPTMSMFLIRDYHGFQKFLSVLFSSHNQWLIVISGSPAFSWRFQNFPFCGEYLVSSVKMFGSQNAKTYQVGCR